MWPWLLSRVPRIDVFQQDNVKGGIERMVISFLGEEVGVFGFWYRVLSGELLWGRPWHESSILIVHLA